MRYILVSAEDSTIRIPLEVPDAIVKRNIHTPIKGKAQKTIQKSNAIIQNGPVHNNNKRRSKPL